MIWRQFAVYRESESGEAFPELYVGDYFADTLHLSAFEHGVLKDLLLQLWLGWPADGDDTRVASAVALSIPEWLGLKPVVLPLVTSAALRVRQKLVELRGFDGQRLPVSAWPIVRRIVFERDAYACGYCGTREDLQVDHLIPLSRGGSNGFDNLITACVSCNLSTGAKTPVEWWNWLIARQAGILRPRRAKSGGEQSLTGDIKKAHEAVNKRVPQTP
jgi:5-methylcytosine-specific restriction endonuclease McrA